MKKILAMVIGILFIGMSICSTAINVGKSTKSFDGNTLYVGGSGPGNYSKIQDAVNNASNGDTVFVYDDSSPYYERITINKSIMLLGEDKNTTIIDGYGGIAVSILSDEVCIHKFTFRKGIYGVRIDVFFGFCNISDNFFIDNEHGISSFKSENNIIEENIFFDTNFSISMYGNNMTITGNTIDHSSGLYVGLNVALFRSTGSNISGNIIKNGDRGISISKSNNNIVYDNIIVSSHHDGICIGESSNNSIIGNNISYCGFYGIILGSDVTNNVICHNNLIYNRESAKDDGNNSWDDGKYGNFWSDYKEWHPDAKKKIREGIWDTPYEISGGDNKDMRPLIQQWPKSFSKPSQNIEQFRFSKRLERWPIVCKMLDFIRNFVDFMKIIENGR